MLCPELKSEEASPPVLPAWRARVESVPLLARGFRPFFLLAAVIGHGGYADGEVGGDGLVLTLIGFVLLTLGGWLGGSIVFVHGMRVLNLVDESADRASSPLPHQEPTRGREHGPD